MFSRTNQFDKLLEKATSHLKLEPDWVTILQICDLIRQGDCPPKYALAGIKKKLFNQNPHIANFALLVLESLVKNCGYLIHDEIGNKGYMEQLRELVKTTQHEQVRTKTLELIQAWAYAFRSNPKYHAVQETVTIMKAEGYKFPALKESDAMFSADTAPEWVDASVCHRCRVSFGVVQRKHHCRACGNVFCGQCSSKTSTLPKFGIEKEVRVCEACFDLYNKPRSGSPHTKSESDSLPAEYLSSSLSQQSQNPKPKKTEEELKEEEDIQLALALSQSEAEAKEKEKKRLTSEIMHNAATVHRSKTPTLVKEEEEEEDPELARYLNRSYWEERHVAERTSEKKKTASPDHFRVSPAGPPSAPTTPTHQLENGEVSESELKELNEFVSFLKSQVEIFVNRMKSNSSRGRSISNDSAVQKLFMNVTTNHSKLLRYIHQQDDLRVYYEGLQDKLAQVKDAMMALDALREEHREKLRREAEEAERLKQLQMAQKLQIMRKKKQEYLQYQRQLAIQKVQEQEREMQMRQEQQKQQYLMGSMAVSQGYVSWDPNMGAMQPPPQQYAQQYQSLPHGYMPPPAYSLSGPSGNIPQQPMPGMVPPGMMPPQQQGIPPSGPHSLPQQPRGPPPGQQPPGPGQPRVGPPQQNQPIGPMHTSQLPPMHHHQIPSTNYQGMPLPGQNPPIGPGGVPQTPSLVMQQGGPQIQSTGPPNLGSQMPIGGPLPPGGPQNVLPPGASQNMVLPPGAQQGMPISQGSQQRLPQGQPPNVPITGQMPQQGPPGMQQGPPGIPQTGQQQVNQQNVPQQFQTQTPTSGGEQNQSNSNTGELISFD